jgi:hypothetical protein
MLEVKLVSNKKSIFTLFQFNFIADLLWDPGEWSLRAINSFEKTSFFGYFVKRGYQKNKGHNMDARSFLVSLKNMGVNEQQCSAFIGRLWHNS